MISTEKEAAPSRNATTDPRRELLSRIIASSYFSKSERLSSLLVYVCDLTLNGRADDISEHKIGRAVFGRSEDYDSANDGIVRTQVSRLRQKLELYFDGEGADESIRVVIPRGGYVPFFVPRQLSENPTPVITAIPLAEPVVSSVEPYQVETQRSGSLALAWSLVGVLAIAVLALLLWNTGVFTKVQPAQMAVHSFWNQIFTADQPTMIVPADSSLVIWQGFMKQDIGLAEYLSADYRTAIPIAETPLQQEARMVAKGRYTSIIDLEMIQLFSQISQAEKGKLEVRYARDLRPNDLKQGNIILSGAPEANPWVQLFEHDMNFVFSYDRAHQTTSVLNRIPRDGEPRQWNSKPTDGQHHVFGVVAYLPNLSGNGNVLILEGTSMAGTECALDFVSDNSQLLPFLKQIRRSNGKLPHFELVLGTNNMSGNAVKSNILAWRTTN
jgi:hypothetical protein